jgi:2-dehydro-3-deoxyphosphogluconate aldolase/(4S)-4-hydroxy-2-oxoglutarate aldolase
MARFTRMQVASKMMETGMVPIFNHKDIEICKKVIRACYEGGVHVFELTNRGDFTHEVFSELNKYVIKEMPDMILGVGTIVDAGTTSLYIQLGANFVVSPILNEDMAKVCNRRKVLWLPGCGSVTEISKAEELGAEIVKIFPALELGGPKFVEALKGPMPWSSIMPAGGVDTSEENIKAWFQAGVTCVGMGSKLVGKDIIEKGNYQDLTDTCKKSLELIQKYKK